MSVATEVPRFVLVGAGVTALHTAVATSLVMISHLHPASANGVAFAVATLVSYASNTLWTFERRPNARLLARFVLVSLAGFVLTVAIAGAADMLGFPFYAGIAAVVIVVPGVTFAMHKRWTYRF
jgi:putative flippase GtrA